MGFRTPDEISRSISSARPEIWVGVAMLGSWWGLSIEVIVDEYRRVIHIFFCSDWAFDLSRNRGLLLVFCLFQDLTCFCWMSLSVCQPLLWNCLHDEVLIFDHWRWCILVLVLVLAASCFSDCFITIIKLITPIWIIIAATLQSRHTMKIITC